jgi:hypothetical protein
VSRKKERKERLAAKVSLSKAAMLPTVAAPTIRQILESEASRPMRGGNRDLPATSLFGDPHKQTTLF